MKLTVYYDGQYWVGILEEVVEAKLKAVRLVFGPEPQDGEILNFIKQQMLNLLTRAKPLVAVKLPDQKRINPKRRARQAAKELAQKGIATAAQQALQLQLESQKQERKVLTRLEKEAFQERKREIARQKAKEKHRGR